MAQIRTPFGKKRYIHADYTASGQVYPPIERFINNHVLKYYSNTHSNAHNGRLMAHYICQAKDLIRKSVNAKPCDRVIFTGNGCSGAVMHLIHILQLRKETTPKTRVILTVAEHHSNYLPWTHLPVELVVIPFTNKGIIDMRKIEVALREAHEAGQPTVCSIIAGSNVTGVFQPVTAISKMAHRYGALAMFDYAAIGPYVPIDMHCNADPECYFDAIYLSPHKFLGGPGTAGVLVAHSKLFKNEEPFCPGGGTVRFVCKDFRHYYDDVEKRETGGTPNIVGCIRSGLVFQLKDELLPYIQRREAELNRRVHPALESISGLHLINPPSRMRSAQYPVYSFTIDGLHYNLVVVLLNDLFGIQTRGGVSCCSVYAQHLLHIDGKRRQRIYSQIIKGDGVPDDYGWCRVTFHYTMDDETVEFILRAIRYVAEHGHEYVSEYSYDKASNNWAHRGFKLEFPPLDYKK
jgi:selenocysteine lyase/cysteine desulfurase